MNSIRMLHQQQQQPDNNNNPNTEIRANILDWYMQFHSHKNIDSVFQLT